MSHTDGRLVIATCRDCPRAVKLFLEEDIPTPSRAKTTSTILRNTTEKYARQLRHCHQCQQALPAGREQHTIAAVYWTVLPVQSVPTTVACPPSRRRTADGGRFTGSAVRSPQPGWTRDTRRRQLSPAGTARVLEVSVGPRPCWTLQETCSTAGVRCGSALAFVQMNPGIRTPASAGVKRTSPRVRSQSGVDRGAGV